jgi:lipooligosaccharide transport system ATP-binding protein
MNPREKIVEARALTKRYNGFVAVDAIDLDVHAEECVGLLGPNGAGKTTTVRMITCFSPLTAGDIRVFGMDVMRRPREVKARLGICPQEDNLDPDLTVLKNLLIYASFFDLPRSASMQRARELLAFMQLEDKAKSKVQELSGGMKRRLVLARALINRPSLLVLDEPTTGLDPQARHLIWQRVRQLKAQGTTVLLTTHYMEEASQLCDRVILMDQGRILLQGTPAALIEKEVGRQVLEVWNLTPELVDCIGRDGWIYERVEDRILVYLKTAEDAGRLLNACPASQEHLLRNATLEDVFLRRSGRALRD